MRVLGIDPGVHVLGYGVVEASPEGDFKLLEGGVIRTAKAGKELPNKLKLIYTEICNIIKDYSPDVMAVEELFSSYEHPRPAIIMGHARGVILMAAAQHNINVAGYTPNKIKKFLTGNGHADKRQMQLMVQSTLNLPSIPKPPDVADAIAVGLCHLNQIR